METIQALAQKFEEDGNPQDLSEDDFYAAKFIAAPWTEEDGEFPEDANIVLTHWAFEGEDAVEGQGMGVWQSCEQPSGEVLESFIAEYPPTNSPEPNGI